MSGCIRLRFNASSTRTLILTLLPLAADGARISEHAVGDVVGLLAVLCDHAAPDPTGYGMATRPLYRQAPAFEQTGAPLL